MSFRIGLCSLSIQKCDLNHINKIGVDNPFTDFLFFGAYHLQQLEGGTTRVESPFGQISFT
jgi:hypothetical protein